MHRVLATTTILAWALLALGCSRSKPVFELTMRGGQDMNNGGHYTVVRVYQLVNNTKFSEARFEPFWENDEDVLAGELVPGTKKQEGLYPDEPKALSLELEKETKFVGFAAKLFEPDGDKWRKIYSVDELKGKNNMVVCIRHSQLLADC